VIYDCPAPDAPLDQGDLIDACPILAVASYLIQAPDALEVKNTHQRVLVMTQTCDFANTKTTVGTVAAVFEAQQLIDDGRLKPADVKGPLRSGRIWGVYFLPADTALGLGEMIVDFHRLHTVQLDLLLTLCQAGRRRGRIRPLYREHLAKHFADTYSRIGLPRPYETL
jgi:hypothetical protein